MARREEPMTKLGIALVLIAPLAQAADIDAGKAKAESYLFTLKQLAAASR